MIDVNNYASRYPIVEDRTVRVIRRVLINGAAAAMVLAAHDECSGAAQFVM